MTATITVATSYTTSGDTTLQFASLSPAAMILTCTLGAVAGRRAGAALGQGACATPPDRPTTIRLPMAIYLHLESRNITTPTAIGEALGMPVAEATSLLTRHQWREGDVALLQAAAKRLGV
jgi:hypothetical protein